MIYLKIIIIFYLIFVSLIDITNISFNNFFYFKPAIYYIYFLNQ